MKKCNPKVLLMLLFFLLSVFLVNCKQYLGISKPGRNNEAIVVGYLDAVYFGMYPRMLLINTKTGKMVPLEVIER